MTLSFLYRAFCRVLQLVRLIGRSNVDLAVEVVMLRHEVIAKRWTYPRARPGRPGWASRREPPRSSSGWQRRAPTGACDFFHVDTVLLRRLYVLVFIHHDSRFLRIAGVTAKPVSDWVTQQPRNLSIELAD